MKKIIKLGLIFGMTTLLSLSCSSDKKTTEEQRPAQNITQYQCPMKCEGEKTHDKKGKCSVCKMDLKKIE